MGSFSAELKSEVSDLRDNHEGWGARSILVELATQSGYVESDLPSESTIHRYLVEQGFIADQPLKSDLPRSAKCSGTANKVHERWELDAKGACDVKGVGFQSLINIKDQYSLVHCMSFPVPVASKTSQPRAPYYFWALRLAFEAWGLPEAVQVDKDSVFFENASRSPFPKPIHLWLLSLGVSLCFIQKPPPRENSIIERSHQTIYKQVIQGQKYPSWKALFQNCNKRREVLNKYMPNNSLGRKAPLQAFPEANSSGRKYSLEHEEKHIDLEAIFQYIAEGTWFRKVSDRNVVSLGGQLYTIKQAKPKTQLRITFSLHDKELHFWDAADQLVHKAPIKGINKETIMRHSQKELNNIKYKIFNRRECPIQT